MCTFSLETETPQQQRERLRRAITEASAKVPANERAATQARIHAIKTGEIKPNRRFSQEKDTTQMNSPTEEQIRTELSLRTQEELEQIADVHILFKDDAPPEVIRRHNLRKSIARELLGLSTSRQVNDPVPRF